MGKIYKPAYVQGAIDDLGGDNGNDGEVTNLSYGQVFGDPLYRRATYVGISMAAF